MVLHAVGLFHINLYALVSAPMFKNIFTYDILAEFGNEVT